MTSPRGATARTSTTGFTLVELVLVVSLIAILSGLSISIGIRQWQRERVNGMAVQLAGWLETVRRAALRGSSCVITISSGSVGEDEIVAQTTELSSVAEDNDCLPTSPLRVTANSNMRFSLTTTPEGNFGYTPRGTLWASSTPVVITLSLSEGGPSRCVQVSGLLGVVEVGQSSNGTCTTGTRF